MNFRLTHRGDPIPCPRPRVTKRGNYMPKRYVEYRDALSEALGGRIEAKRIECYFSRGIDSLFGLKAIFFRRGQRKADIDNLLKTVSDAATGIFWVNDSQVREQYGRVIYGSTDPRVEIEIYELTGG